MRTQSIAGDPEAPVDQLQETQRVPVQPVQPVQRGYYQDISGLSNVHQTIQSGSMHHGPCVNVLVDMGGGDTSVSTPHPLVLQGVRSVVFAAGTRA